MSKIRKDVGKITLDQRFSWCARLRWPFLKRLEETTTSTKARKVKIKEPMINLSTGVR
jgi:hypothetical protein